MLRGKPAAVQAVAGTRERLPAKVYAGIGSRETPDDVLSRMRTLAQVLANAGYVLRSGAAHGADAAFEAGAVAAGGRCEIFLPWPGFNHHPSPLNMVSPEALALAATVHPRWARLGRRARALHGRNVHQCLGITLDAPVDFIVCWTPDGAESEASRGPATGGTATAIVLADRRGIPVYNLRQPDNAWRVAAHLREARPTLKGSTEMGSIILLDDELELLTRKVKPFAQARMLKAIGVPFRCRPDGSIVVFRRDIEGPASEKRPGPAPQLRFPETKPRPPKK